MKKKVLIIDDEQIFHFINAKIISVSGIGCEVQSVLNGAEALKMLKNYPADFVFIDLYMPVMSGFEFLSEVQKMEWSPNPKPILVIMTSSADKADMEKAKILGADHFVSKPLTEEIVNNLLK